MLAVLSLVALVVPSAHAMPGACGTLDRLRAARPVAQPQSIRLLSDGKATRSPFGVPNRQESDNFVLRWGNSDPPAEADRAAMLTGLERSWTVQIEDMGHPSPEHADTVKVNVFVGDTGDGAPPSYGAAGYFTPDSEGYPMIVLSPETVASPESGVLTAAHELYHAVQWATGSYDYGEGSVGAWYWEATASWIETVVYPDMPEYSVFLFGYALLPHLPLDFFDYPDTGALQEYHQYGAFMFPQYLAEFEEGLGLLRDSWVSPQAGSRDPLVNLDAGLLERETNLGNAFSAFAARNATWDYADGSVYAANVEAYGAYFPEEDQGVAARVEVAQGADLGWQEVPPGRLPQRFGYTLVEVTPAEGVVSVRFNVEAARIGSAGSPASWGMSVVAHQGDTRTYHPLLLDEAGVAAVDLAAAADTTLWLVAASWTADREAGETFSWRFRVQDGLAGVADDTGHPSLPADTGTRTGDSGLESSPGRSQRTQTRSRGCAAVGPNPPVAAALLWVFAGVCRRRRC